MPVNSGVSLKTHRLTLSAERIETGTGRVVSQVIVTGLIRYN